MYKITATFFLFLKSDHPHTSKKKKNLPDLVQSPPEGERERARIPEIVRELVGRVELRREEGAEDAVSVDVVARAAVLLFFARDEGGRGSAESATAGPAHAPKRRVSLRILGCHLGL